MPDSSSNPSTHHSHDGHLHLDVVAPRRDSLSRRFLVVALSVLAMSLFAASFTQPWWNLKLYAPQYPRGLTLVISLSGLSGDVREIDTLNHYIGMAHLEEAAVMERRFARYAVAGLCFIVLGMTLLMGKKLGKLIVVGGALFPLAFLADSFYWLYTFGHSLDRRAPLHIPEFTPQLFGNGTIGQFMTFAVPERGFWLAVAGVVVLAVVTFMRGRICAACKQAGTCGAVCKNGFVFVKP